MGEDKMPGSDEAQAADMVPVVGAVGIDGPRSAGIVTELAELPREAYIDIRALARILGRSVRSVERAVRRGELPPPFRFMGKRVWMAGVIVDHMAARQQAALRLVGKRDLRRASGG